MPLASVQLTTIGKRFIAAMNAREYALAASMYADEAVYESPALVDDGGQIAGRAQIMSYFKKALDGDDNFQLAILDQFTGLNMTVMLSSTGGHTYIDVLRTNDDGLIINHMEVSPKCSPVNFRAHEKSAEAETPG